MFGSDVTFESFISGLQNLLKEAPAMRATDARLVMTEEYHKQFNIASHDNPDRMLSLVAMHRTEDPITGSLLEERMREFAELDVYKVFGCSWSEFKDQQRDECERMFELMRPRKEAERQVAEEQERKLRKDFPGTP